MMVNGHSKQAERGAEEYKETYQKVHQMQL
jgi:hypothetical protein